MADLPIIKVTGHLEERNTGKDTHYYCGVYYAPETRTYIVVERYVSVVFYSIDNIIYYLRQLRIT